MNWQGEPEHFVLLIGNDLIYTGVIISTASLTVKKKKKLSQYNTAALPLLGDLHWLLTLTEKVHILFYVLPSSCLLVKDKNSGFGNPLPFPQISKSLFTWWSFWVTIWNTWCHLWKYIESPHHLTKQPPRGPTKSPALPGGLVPPPSPAFWCLLVLIMACEFPNLQLIHSQNRPAGKRRGIVCVWCGGGGAGAMLGPQLSW